MTVNELLNTMTKPYRNSLWEIFIDDEKLECIYDPEFLESEVDHWYIGNRIEGYNFCSNLYIFTRQFAIAEIQKKEHLMKVRDLLETFNPDWKELLSEIIIDGDPIREFYDLEDIPLKYLEREVIQWNFECRIDGQIFVQNLIIESKVSEQEKVLNDLGI